MSRELSISKTAIASLSAALLVGVAQLGPLPSGSSATVKNTSEQSPAPIPLQKYGGDPHGPDPHGDDPRDEQHDSSLPANKDRSQGKAPKDVYGGQYPNDQAPY
ncbi:hypothetical protein BH11CYA1_BH11CYA1_47520 [soil metagenome]